MVSRTRIHMKGGDRLLWLLVLAMMSTSALSQNDSEASDPAYSRKGADTCLACHEDAVTLGIFKSAHGVPNDPGGPFGHGELQCEACHGAGGAHSARVRRGQDRPALIEFGSGTTTPVGVQNETCVGCHSGDTGTGWHAGPHGGGEIACADCHTSHARHDPVLAGASQVEVCADCHSSLRSAGLKPYGHIVDGKVGCAGCHSVHDADGPDELVRQTLNQTCYQCHADKRGPFVWEHAPVGEDCAVCHASHGSNHPGMLTRRGPLLCQSCHSQAGHPSLANTAEGLPAGQPSQFLLGQNCMNCHSQVHGSNHPSGSRLMR